MGITVDQKAETLKKYIRQTVRDLERIPTMEEHVQDEDLSEKQTEEMIRDLLDPELIETLDLEERNREQGEFVSDTNKSESEKQIEKALLREIVEEVWETLSGQEKAYLRVHYGIKGNRPTDMRMLSPNILITRERVRQIESKLTIKKISSFRCRKQTGSKI